ncbi:MAG TPA: ATP synthase subunit I [Terriglobales bacterium]|nr:ATP synthase subunit I [Terriglobales bacterium]
MTGSGAEDVPSCRPDPEDFFGGATRRIPKFLLSITAALVLPVWWFFGVRVTVGFVAGALVSWINFQSLARGVAGIASRIVERHSRERGQIIVLRFVLRYVLVAGVAYAIFTGSAQAFRGFLFGVCLPAAAMLMEAAYEGYTALRRGY